MQANVYSSMFTFTPKFTLDLLHVFWQSKLFAVSSSKLENQRDLLVDPFGDRSNSY